MLRLMELLVMNFLRLCSAPSDMDAYLRSQELAGAASLGLVSAIRLGYD
jgi:hypothetical protein